MSPSVKSIYEDQGYFYPLNAFTEDEAGKYAQKLTRLSQSVIASSLGYRGQLNQLHVVCPFVNDIIRNTVILDAVESILGPDLLVWGVSLFLKPAGSPGFVSWHQDLTYWGLNNDREVAAWIALGPVNKVNGCMRFLPKSHKSGQISHSDAVDDSNILTRGQSANIEIDEDNCDFVELKAGQVSLHHGHLLHASGPNLSDQPRLGMVINYIATSVRQSVAKSDFAMLVRGTDSFNHFQHVPVPKTELDAEGLAWHRKMVGAHNEALYEGAKNRDSAPKVS